MKLDAELGRRRRRQEVVSGGGGRMPEDVVALILSHLPLKSLGRFKAVTRSWYRLIQSLNLPPFLLGLFYRILTQKPNYEYLNSPSPRKDIFRYIVGRRTIDSNSAAIIDPSLSFLPISAIRVIDCCNGLLFLCQPYCTVFSDFSYYICNPLTKSWTQLYGCKWRFYWLDFNPKVSSNFKIFALNKPLRRKESVLNISVLSSETPTMTWKLYEPIRFRYPSEEYYNLMSRYKHHALWEGSLYLLFSSNAHDFGDAGRIMRFDLLEDHVADPQLIELPKGTKKPKDVVIGRLRSKLCLAGLDWIGNNNNNTNNNNNNNNNNSNSNSNSNCHQLVARLRVWSLSNRGQTVWVMEHDSIINSSHLLYAQATNCLNRSTYLCQFHPFLDVVFILSKDVVYAYDLKNLWLNEACRIGSKELEVILASTFPFLPSMADYSTQWKTEHRRETSHSGGSTKLNRS